MQEAIFGIELQRKSYENAHRETLVAAPVVAAVLVSNKRVETEIMVQALSVLLINDFAVLENTPL
ncbi:hypothetical protein ABK046_49455, partial [Streptomyces caeruleatus]